jgi:D-aminopeptidase
VGKQKYTLGALVQANYGVRSELRIAGVPVGQVLKDSPVTHKRADQGSIIIVIATDAPLLPHQLKRLARRASMGLARNGSYAGNGSGDIFIAFSTANAQANQVNGSEVTMLGNESMDALFLATIQTVEESIVNAMIAAETMKGVNGQTIQAIDQRELIDVLKRFGRVK